MIGFINLVLVFFCLFGFCSLLYFIYKIIHNMNTDFSDFVDNLKYKKICKQIDDYFTKNLEKIKCNTYEVKNNDKYTFNYLNKLEITKYEEVHMMVRNCMYYYMTKIHTIRNIIDKDCDIARSYMDLCHLFVFKDCYVSDCLPYSDDIKIYLKSKDYRLNNNSICISKNEDIKSDNIFENIDYKIQHIKDIHDRNQNLKDTFCK